MPEIDEYPEHDKLSALDGDNNVVGDFLTWLGSKGYSICEWRDPPDDEPVPFDVNRSAEAWIAEYFGIDQNRLEDEKQAMLDRLRAANSR